MSWKDWPYWLKGGIIGAGIGIINLILATYLSNQMPILSIPFMVVSLLLFGLNTNMGNNPSIYIPILYATFTLVLFIIGAILGWIVGKITQKKAE